MVEENIINEFAVIFNRAKTEHQDIEEFIPVKVVEGYYDENTRCFIDADQNVYQHITSPTEIGNAYANRISIIDILNEFNNMSLIKIKEKMLLDLLQYSYYKSINKESSEYCHVRIYDKETGEISLFTDRDTAPSEESNDEEVPNENEENILPSKIEVNLTPQAITSILKKNTKGQDDAISKIVTLIWIKYNMPQMAKTNMLITGAPGIGKTTLLKGICSLKDIPISLYSLSGTLNGYEIEEMLLKLYYDTNLDMDKTENGIIVIDNINQICLNQNNPSNASLVIQNELLSAMEGCERVIPIDDKTMINIDTSNITFICCGNLPTNKNVDTPIGINLTNQENNNIILADDKTVITKTGLITELAECMPIAIELNDISKDKTIIKEILLDSDGSIFNQISQSLITYGINIINFDEAIDAIIDDAINKNLTIRQIINKIANMFLNVTNKIANNPGKYNALIIGKNIINDSLDFNLLTKKIKLRKKTKNN